MNIEFTNNPSTSDINFITESINSETKEFGSAFPFSFLIRDHHNNIIAGCNGSVVYGVIYTDQLWVHQNHRKKGLGQKLMHAVHEYGHTCGCTMATVNTMSFQNACGFYEKLGYVVDFERHGHVQESHCLFLKKVLSTPSQHGA